MIELLFGESEAASMQVAKCKQISIVTDGPTAVFAAGKKKPPRKVNTGWIEGTSDEVICLGFLLDIGDIREAVTSTYRKRLICSLYNQNQWGQDEDLEQELYEAVDKYESELQRLKDYLEQGEAVRIWYSDAPYSRCGFYHICHLLSQYENEVRVVKLPECMVWDNCVINYSNWSEVAAEEFAGFLFYEKILLQEEIHMYALEWTDQVNENSPLRAVINGKLIGVPEDFYDFRIWQRITDKPEKEARIIGDILGTSQIGVGDWWYAKRIEYHIRQGNIRVAKDSENKYARLIERVL